MQISAIQELTLLDYPGKLAAIIFTAGCNMRCGYCHNSQFVLPEKIKKIQSSFIPFAVIENFLKQRKKKLEAVVITGGEPTMQPDLSSIIKKIKKLGLLVKLDTNGTNPALIEKLLKNKQIDYLAMDLKASLARYSELTKFSDTEKIKKSINLIKNSTINYEFRSTLVPGFHTTEELEKMGTLLQGASLWCLQNFRNTSVLDEKFLKQRSFTERQLEELKNHLKKYVKKIEIRS